jgi:hypothetical protein
MQKLLFKEGKWQRTCFSIITFVVTRIVLNELEL